MSVRSSIAVACGLAVVCLVLVLTLASPRRADARSSAAPTAADACAGQTVGQFCAQYYNSTDLSGAVAFSQLDSVPINHDWGAGSPAPGIVGADNFSARWTGRFLVDTGAFPDKTYTFIAVADDGVRVWVDGAPIVDQWRVQAPSTYRADVTLGPGEHTVLMEYYENLGGAVAKLGWWEYCRGCYRAEYFNNKTLSGLPILVRFEDSINHDWGNGSPDPMIGADNFSARWTGRFDFEARDQTFTATADDGVRVWVDDQPLIDGWLDQAPTTYQATRSLTAGAHTVRMEYYERLGGAVAKLSWMAACPLGEYRADYFNNKTLSGSPALSRCEAAPLSYDWKSGSPAPGVNADGFSVRWSGTFAFAADVYTFKAIADDGIRLWVDGKPLLDKWLDQAPTAYRASRSLAAGTHVVRIEYYEAAGGAVAGVEWVQGCLSDQYRAEYFNNKSLAGTPALVRCDDAPISFNWGTGGPGNGLSADNFSVRWTGTFDFPDGNYAFWVTGDDGVRLWVDGVLLIDKWLLQAPTDYSATRSLPAGNHQVTFEYFESAGGAVARASWVRGADVGLDPGHHRLDVGATGAGLYEYQVTLDIAFRVRTILQAAGYSVNLSRTDANPVSSWSSGNFDANLLIEMAARIRAVGPVRAYVPIHLNGSSDPSVRGTETYYNVDNNPENRAFLLASALQPSIVNRIREAGYWTIDRGVKSDLLAGRTFGHYPSLRGPYPSALTESLFLSNPTEASLLKQGYIRQAIAQGIADGIAAYLR
jgi:N-acetylmuramoyl-L-alanine amidase